MVEKMGELAFVLVVIGLICWLLLIITITFIGAEKHVPKSARILLAIWIVITGGILFSSDPIMVLPVVMGVFLSMGWEERHVRLCFIKIKKKFKSSWLTALASIKKPEVFKCPK
jgi:hypothetical protein